MSFLNRGSILRRRLIRRCIEGSPSFKKLEIGLASSDEINNGNGRTSPSVNRFFDYAVNGFTATGQPDNGFLATDRRHAFKAYGGYSFNKWMGKSHATDVSFFYTALQGTPMTTFVNLVASRIVLSKRGDLGRTPLLTQTDLWLTHRFKIKERVSMAFDFNIFNVFNQNTVISLSTGKYRVTNTIAAIDIDPNYDGHTQTLTNVFNKILSGQIGPQIDGLASGANRSIQGPPLSKTIGRTNPVSSLYGQPNDYQNARNVQFGFRINF